MTRSSLAACRPYAGRLVRIVLMDGQERVGYLCDADHTSVAVWPGSYRHDTYHLDGGGHPERSTPDSPIARVELAIAHTTIWERSEPTRSSGA